MLALQLKWRLGASPRPGITIGSIQTGLNSNRAPLAAPGASPLVPLLLHGCLGSPQRIASFAASSSSIGSEWNWFSLDWVRDQRCFKGHWSCLDGDCKHIGWGKMVANMLRIFIANIFDAAMALLAIIIMMDTDPAIIAQLWLFLIINPVPDKSSAHPS